MHLSSVVVSEWHISAVIYWCLYNNYIPRVDTGFEKKGFIREDGGQKSLNRTAGWALEQRPKSSSSCMVIFCKLYYSDIAWKENKTEFCQLDVIDGGFIQWWRKNCLGRSLYQCTRLTVFTEYVQEQCCFVCLKCFRTSLKSSSFLVTAAYWYSYSCQILKRHLTI